MTIKPDRPKLTLPKRPVVQPVQSAESTESAETSVQTIPLIPPVKPIRSILKAKSLRIVIPAKPIQPITPFKPIQSVAPAKPVKAAKAVKTAKPQPNAKKEQLRLENIRLGLEAHAQKVAQFAKAKPPIQAYLTAKLALQETVLVDGVECLRPLMIGIHKQVFDLFKSRPDLQDCSNTVLNHIIGGVMENHTSKPQYLAGLLKFDHRFDFDGNPVGTVSDKHKSSAEKILSNINRAS